MTRLSNPPLALDLHYLLTAYGSEDWQAEALLGFALLMLHENPVLTRTDISTAHAPTCPHTNPLSAPLAAAGLADQIEMLKITPATLGREEMAWLWTALKADYRPTFPFQVSVVLIEPDATTVSPLPVLLRNISVTAGPHAASRRSRRSCPRTASRPRVSATRSRSQGRRPRRRDRASARQHELGVESSRRCRS